VSFDIDISSAQLNIWVSGLDTPVVPRDVVGLFHKLDLGPFSMPSADGCKHQSSS